MVAVTDTEVQVLPGYPAGSAGDANGFASSYAILRTYQNFAEVTVNRFNLAM